MKSDMLLHYVVCVCVCVCVCVYVSLRVSIPTQICRGITFLHKWTTGHGTTGHQQHNKHNHVLVVPA